MPDDDPFALVAAACRVLYAQGHEHFHLGHVSARLPDGGIAVKRAGLGLGEVTRADVVRVGLDGRLRRPVDPGVRLHAELPLHLEIYRSRPEVEAVVHTHPFAAAALSASSARLQLVGQDSLPFAGGIGYFDEPRLVTTQKLGQQAADALGGHAAVIMRNHGIATAGTDVRHAAFLAVSLERSLQLQLAASSLGGVVEMSVVEAREMNDSMAGVAARLGDIWDYLVRDARRRSHDPW
jgi:L-fuculose-phosphate aldolase